MNAVFVITIFTVSCVVGNSLIQPKLNPGCLECTTNNTLLVYIKAQDDSFDYIIHQVWDFTGHIPTMLYIIGNENSTLEVEWSNNKPEQIRTNGSFYSFTMILNNLLEYNDTNPERVYFDYSYPHREISLRDVTWRLKECVLSSSNAYVRVRGALSWERHRMNGTIDMRLLLLPVDGRSPFLPRLYHSVNTTQVDMSLVGLSVSPQYTAGRFALRYVIASNGSAADVLKYSVQRSIDDEYTPGVFETINLMTPVGVHELGGFVQYRPVAYTMRVRDVENSVNAFVHNYNKTKIPSDCLAGKYYSQFAVENVFIDDIVASFGQTGDGYYNKTNYTVWTYSIGYGTPPAESASVFLIIMLVLGIGTPIVALACSFMVSARMIRRHREALLEEEEEA